MTAPGPQYPSTLPLKWRTSGRTREYYIPLTFPPGIWHNGTRDQATGQWYNSSRVRFYNGIIAPIGGWINALNSSGSPLQFGTIPRTACGFRDNLGVGHIGFGSASKLYVYTDQSITDVTPAGLSVGNVNGSYSAGTYGSGLYGVGNYGFGSGGTVIIDADNWTLDNFGQDLVGCLTSDGKLYQVVSPYTAAGTQIASSPTGCRAVFVSPEKFVVSLGGVQVGTANPADPKLVQWDNQGASIGGSGQWTPQLGSQAGFFPLAAKGRLMRGLRLKAFSLLFTEIEVFMMTYIGQGANAYAFQQLADSNGLLSPNAVAVVGQNAYWMSHGKFSCWNGVVTPLPCNVLDYVFGNFNDIQRSKVVAFPLEKFNEIVWFYPSATSNENDSYVSYNYVENTWAIGQLARSAGLDHGVFDAPMMVDPSGFIYAHETGTLYTDGGLPFLESGPYNISGGDQVLAVQAFLIDGLQLSDLNVSFFIAQSPTDTETEYAGGAVQAPMTMRIPFGRFLRVRFDQNGVIADHQWRIGNMRVGVLPGGYR